MATRWPTGAAASQLTRAQATSPTEGPVVEFDFDTGNFIRDLIITRAGAVFS